MKTLNYQLFQDSLEPSFFKKKKFIEDNRQRIVSKLLLSMFLLSFLLISDQVYKFIIYCILLSITIVILFIETFPRTITGKRTKRKIEEIEKLEKEEFFNERKNEFYSFLPYYSSWMNYYGKVNAMKDNPIKELAEQEFNLENKEKLQKLYNIYGWSCTCREVIDETVNPEHIITDSHGNVFHTDCDGYIPYMSKKKSL